MSIVNTRIQDYRVQSPNMTAWTARPSRYGAFNVFAGGNNEADSIISPELLATAASAVGQDVQVPVYDTDSVSIGSTRSVTIADSENTSQLYTVSFTTYAWGFTIIPSLFMNNEHSMQSDFNRKFTKYLNKFAEVLDTAALSALDTNKTQVFGDDLGYTITANTVAATLAQQDDVVGDLKVMQKANDFYGPYHLVGNPGVERRIAKLGEHGLYNDVNRTMQYMGYNVQFTNGLSNALNKIATGYLVNSGTVGQLYRHEREAILGTVTPDGHAWGTTILPMLNIPCDTYYYEGVGDYNAIAGAASADMTRVNKQHFGFAIEVANVVAYNDDLAANANPIIKFDIADA